MSRNIRNKVTHKSPGLNVALLFPIATAFLITFSGTRIINHLFPNLFLVTKSGLHIHHFTYGFFVLAASGYLALIFSQPRAKFMISLLHGFGLGLAFDEFGMWLRLSDDYPSRWSYDGALILGGVILMILTLGPGFKLIMKMWPYKASPGVDFNTDIEDNKGIDFFV